MNNHINIFKECFSKISTEELFGRIALYRERLKADVMSEAEIQASLANIFQVELNEANVTFFIKNDWQSDPYHLINFYRIRKFTTEDYSALRDRKFPSMRKESDIWTRRPKDITTYGRVNRPGEPVLYLSSLIENAIYETECNLGDCFFLQVYENKGIIRKSILDANFDLTQLTEEENRKRRIMHDFLIEEFSRYVPYGNEYLYKSSVCIYNYFFRSDVTQCFQYPSIKTHRKIGSNYSFSAESAKDSLNFVGVIGCRLFGDKYTRRVKPIFDGTLTDRGSFLFTEPNTGGGRLKSFSMLRETIFSSDDGCHEFNL